MADEQIPTSMAPRGRRYTQRHRRGAHNLSLSNNARLALTKHLARKGQSTKPPASDPTYTTIGNYHQAPLNARQITADVYPPVSICADLASNPIYIHHQSGKRISKAPLPLRPSLQHTLRYSSSTADPIKVRPQLRTYLLLPKLSSKLYTMFNPLQGGHTQT